MPILGVIASSAQKVPVVTGGTLTSDATYYYRTFSASGTLSVTVAPLTADVILVGGGAGGGGSTGPDRFSPTTYGGGAGGSGALAGAGSVTLSGSY